MRQFHEFTTRVQLMMFHVLRKKKRNYVVNVSIQYSIGYNDRICKIKSGLTTDDELDSPREQPQQQELHSNGDVIQRDTQDDDSSSDSEGDDGDKEDDDEEIINSTSTRKVSQSQAIANISTPVTI